MLKLVFSSKFLPSFFGQDWNEKRDEQIKKQEMRIPQDVDFFIEEEGREYPQRNVSDSSEKQISLRLMRINPSNLIIFSEMIMTLCGSLRADLWRLLAGIVSTVSDFKRHVLDLVLNIKCSAVH